MKNTKTDKSSVIDNNNIIKGRGMLIDQARAVAALGFSCDIRSSFLLEGHTSRNSGSERGIFVMSSNFNICLSLYT